MLYAYEPFDLMAMQTVELMDENAKLKLENAKLRELVREQSLLADAVHTYWADGLNREQFDVLMRATAKVIRLSEELRIEVE